MSDLTSQLLTSRYDYSAPSERLNDFDPLFREITETAAFCRLKDVRFLGGIDYILISSPNGSLSNKRFTRHQHSLGVGLLALFYAQLRGLNERMSRLAFAAGLLHDIGHAPLSHSLEPLFAEAFGINHHEAARHLITGEVPLGKELLNVLRSYHIEPDEVLAVIEGDVDPFEGFFSGPINFDTIEAILRSRKYMKPMATYPSPIDVVRAATLRESTVDRQIVDRFWEYKHEVYKYIIRSKDGVFADYICQKVARDHLHRLSKTAFFMTERSLFKRLPKLRRSLSRMQESDRKTIIEEPLSYKSRIFYVDNAANFFDRGDKERYKQIKTHQQFFPATDGSTREDE